MKTHPILIVSVATLAIFFAFSALAYDHHELNGTWTLAATQSDFAGQPVVQTGTVTINDRDGIIVIERKFTYQGANETYFYSDSLGNENKGTIRSGKDLKTKTKWDHDVLKVTTTQDGAVTTESYSLRPDGTMAVNVVRPDHQPMTLVFTRK